MHHAFVVRAGPDVVGLCVIASRSVLDRGKAGGRSGVRMGGALAPPRTRLTHKMPRNCRGSIFSLTIGPLEVLNSI